MLISVFHNSSFHGNLHCDLRYMCKHVLVCTLYDDITVVGLSVMALKNMVHMLWSCAVCYTSLRSSRKSSCSIEVATCICVYQVHPQLACLCYPLPPILYRLQCLQGTKVLVKIPQQVHCGIYCTRVGRKANIHVAYEAKLSAILALRPCPHVQYGE